jgi:hypothetical protein
VKITASVTTLHSISLRAPVNDGLQARISNEIGCHIVPREKSNWRELNEFTDVQHSLSNHALASVEF